MPLENNPLNEATDKLAFLRWLESESFIAPLADDMDRNRVVNRWINHKIALAGSSANDYLTRWFDLEAVRRRADLEVERRRAIYAR